MEANEIWERAKALARDARQVVRRQPTLYSNRQFADVQGFTLEHQSWVKRQMMAGEFRRLTLLQPRQIRLEPHLTRAYTEYGQVATALSKELFEHFRAHRDMNTESRRRAYEQEYRTLIARLQPPSNPGRYDSFHCDYVAQPTNALWFAVNALDIIDDYGKTLYPQQWPQAKSRLEAAGRFDSIETINGRIDQFEASPIGR